MQVEWRDWEGEIRRACRQRDIAEAAYQAKAATVRALIREATTAGVPQKRVADFAGISRQRIHLVLRDSE